MNRVYAPGRGATGRVLRDLARSFAREGWQVTVITTGPKRVRELDGSVKVIRVKGSTKPGNALSYAWIWLKMLFVALRHPASDLLVTQSDPPLLAVAGNIVKRFKGGRHINWCHDIYPDLFPALDIKFPKFVLRGMERMTKRALENADKVVVIGRCMARHLSDRGFSANKVAMIPNWPDFELSAPAAPEAAAPVRKGLAPEKQWYDGAKPFEEQIKDQPKFRVLYAGNIGLAHPVDTILDAAEILNTENPEIEFVFVGDGPRFEKLSAERTKRGLGNIRLLPYQPLKRLRRVMESGDLHLVSLKEEAAGMAVPSKIYSAFAAQRPCVFVGPEDSEAAQVITDFKAGTVVRQGRAEDLAVRIKHYRFNGEEWFAAQNGAAEAGQVFVPGQPIAAWLERAWSIVKDDGAFEMLQRKVVSKAASAPAAQPEAQPEKEVA